MKKFLNEFKDFAMKGNMIDLAIGVVIGGAYYYSSNFTCNHSSYWQS